MSAGVLSMTKFEAYLSASKHIPTLLAIVRDGQRNLFREEEPKWITFMPAMDNQWSRCLQTLEGHSEPVNSVAFSHNSAQLVSASYDTTVKIWDTGSGECLQTLGVGETLEDIAFSTTDSHLLTNRGALDLTLIAATGHPSYQGCGYL
ncbi:hypothetical protein BP6252_13259 [Coleophoma cylindrospora]|uniref:Mitochondrial division protein 1 n=1 Tax=Coleophoma cylindrospora TaxID=1849047 RepID=A0A3D8QAB5_9HELO|nr:hypothetical protein BP6252_13259 [Coleophoma cylindrospora]